MLKTRINNILNIKYPIIQGAMAWISNSSLASAVSKAGGLGVIAAGNAPAEWLREEIHKVREITDKPFAVNIMLLSPYAEEICELVIEEKVPIVITGAGNPGKYLSKWKENNLIVIPVVPSVSFAIRLEKLGVDAVICEGTEAGGHVGEITTMSLVPQVVDKVSIPVIAAGGIADGRGMSAALSLGAEGVQIGTRFLVAKECTVHDNYKKKILNAKDTDSIVTARKTGHPVRVLKNKLSRKYKELDKSNANVDEYEDLGKGALYQAAIEGNVTYGSVMSGQIAGLVNKEQNCSEIIEEILLETENIIRKNFSLYS